MLTCFDMDEQTSTLIQDYLVIDIDIGPIYGFLVINLRCGNCRTITIIWDRFFYLLKKNKK